MMFEYIFRSLRGFFIRRSAARAFAAPPDPRVPFREGELIPMRGVQFRVAKIVAGPLPVLMLSPVAPTKRALITKGQKLRAAKRHHDRIAREMHAAVDRELSR